MKPSLLLLLVFALFSCDKSQPPVEPRLAPEGVYYLVEYVPVTTDTGVIGYRAGTQVQYVGMRGDKVAVRAEEREFVVAGDKLTNDLDLAELAGRRDAESQRQLATVLEQVRAEARVQQDRENALSDQQQRESAGRWKATQANHFKSSLNRSSYNRDDNVARSPDIYYRNPLFFYRLDAKGHRYWVDRYGGWHYY
jgi:hypothetical protein